MPRESLDERLRNLKQTPIQRNSENEDTGGNRFEAYLEEILSGSYLSLDVYNLSRDARIEGFEPSCHSCRSSHGNLAQLEHILPLLLLERWPVEVFSTYTLVNAPDLEVTGEATGK